MKLISYFLHRQAQLKFWIIVCVLIANKCIAQPIVSVQQPSFKTDTFNILSYGAKADGLILNTKSINDAITACNKNGGGVVLVPKGFWLTGPLVLLSNVNLHVAKDALLQFTSDKDQYELVAGNYEGLPAYRNQSPLSANGAENIAITGEGIVDGNGGAWRAVNHKKLSEMEWKKLIASGGIVNADSTQWYPSKNYLQGSQTKNAGVIVSGKTAADYADIKDFLRPNLLVFTKCKKVLLEGITFQNSPAWCLHPLMCEDLTVRNVYVKNPWYAQNGDGIDVESCSNVLIESSTFDVGDDGICVKSGRDEEGRKRGMPTKNMEVRNCVVYHAHGGFVIGSEMSGGAKDIYVHDCTFIGTDIGLRFKTTRGRGGVVENIYASNINMKDIVNQAILFDMYYAGDPSMKDGIPQVETKPVTAATPVFKDFYIDNVVCNGVSKAVFIRGLPEMHISNINLTNLVMQADKGIDCNEASNIHFKNVQLVTKETSPVINVFNSDTVLFDSISYNNNAAVLLKLSGGKTKNIHLINTDTNNAQKTVTFNAGAKESALIK
ncbi:glycoside hydrolase family 28 protein [Ilyomonas limi]|uniref:Glycoside hydrolase family 28 protein n=1 Tax=Ilyomonas limi TaxID=2575867 RepID=A0A4U3KX60_9BACT|nr:glycoside hydrolase family 28 protein [Ilyomonas limi]TKK67010.1 glycoside hydrolase family 28 protein [Ilyomonas limi]